MATPIVSPASLPGAAARRLARRPARTAVTNLADASLAIAQLRDTATCELNKARTIVRLARQSLPECDRSAQDAIVALFVADALLARVADVIGAAEWDAVDEVLQ